MSGLFSGSVQLVSFSGQKLMIGMSFPALVPLVNSATLAFSLVKDLSGFTSYFFPNTGPTFQRTRTVGMVSFGRTTSLTSMGPPIGVHVDLDINYTPNGNAIIACSMLISGSNLTVFNNWAAKSGQGFVFLHVTYPPLMEILGTTSMSFTKSGFVNASWIVAAPANADNMLGPPVGASSSGSLA